MNETTVSSLKALGILAASMFIGFKVNRMISEYAFFEAHFSPTTEYKSTYAKVTQDVRRMYESGKRS